MKKKFTLVMTLLIALISSNASAMHIAEGFLTPSHAILYFILCAPFIALGVREIRKKSSGGSEIKMFIALAGAYSFVLSLMSIPSVTGSTSHPTGLGFGTVLLGPFIMAVVGMLVLFFQTFLLGHGGVTTLGANVFSMAVVGPMLAYAGYRLVSKKSKKWGIFTAAVLANLFTYITTSVQLGLAFPSQVGGVGASTLKFLGLFAVTQIPLALAEGFLTVVLINLLQSYSAERVDRLMEV